MANSVFIFPQGLTVSQLVFSDGTFFSSYAAGKVQLVPGTAGALLPVLALGGSTSSFPALRRNSSNIEVVKADESSYSQIVVLQLAFGSPNTGFIIPTADGSMQLTNAAANNFGILQFGGTTSAFPALKRSSATMKWRLADDSTDAAQPNAATGNATGLTGADTNRINYTPAATAAAYRVTGVVNVTAWTTPASFTVACTYKDASGNARTDTALVIRGSTGASAAAITAVDRWYYVFTNVDIDNSATAITVSTTGTFTGSPVYNHSVILEKVR